MGSINKGIFRKRELNVISSRSDQYTCHSSIVSYSLAYDAIDVMDNENLATAL